MSTDEIKAIRDGMKLTQIEMAAKADVSLGTIQAFENRRLQNPQIRIARKIALAYSLTLEEVLTSQPTAMVG